MDWDQIGLAVEACQNDLHAAVKSGSRPLPTGLVFVERGEKHGVVTVHRHNPILTTEDMTALVDAVRERTPDAQAAGFITVMPRAVWESMSGEAHQPRNTPLDFVGVIHIEHITDGSRTWLTSLENLRVTEGGWKLYRDGIHTTMPSCIDDRRYGATRGQA